MPKLIIEVSEDLHRAIKMKAAVEGKSIRELVTKILEKWSKKE